MEYNMHQCMITVCSMEDCNDALFEGGGPRTVRLHVGGLGPSVISSDLLRTFSPFGTVSSVDIIRTKGRNFAYITLEAPSPQAVKRLFSLYNGCTWKGGQLKLEKAKEFYLDKLRREWEERDHLHEEEQARIKSSASTSTNSMSTEPQILNIYFPKLQKVKKIPMKGLGKHKRSFERVDALPCSILQLCDCTGDCQATSTVQSARETDILVKDTHKKNQMISELPEEKHKPSEMKLESFQEEQLINVSDDELQTNIIDESEKSLGLLSKRKQFDQRFLGFNNRETDILVKDIDKKDRPISEQRNGESKMMTMDLREKHKTSAKKSKSLQQEQSINVSDDELRTNIIDKSEKPLDVLPKRKQSNRRFLGLNNRGTDIRVKDIDKKDTMISELQEERNGASKVMTMDSREKHKTLGMKSKSLLQEQSIGVLDDEIQTNIIDKSEKSLDLLAKRKHTEESHRPEKRVKFDVQSSNAKKDGSVGDGSTLDSNSFSKENDSAISDWVQKASWKSLVGETGRLSFSLSSVLGQSKIQTSENNEVPYQDSKLSIDGSSVPSSRTMYVNSTDNRSSKMNSVSLSHPLKKYQENRKYKEKLSDNGGSTHSELPQPRNSSFLSLVTSDVCPFMKSENSEKEWLESRKAVKEIFKKTHKDATRKMKVLHSKVQC